MASPDPRERVLAAAYASVSRYGMAKTTVEDVAQEAGLSRATLYRLFPGGRDELFGAMVGREMARFFARLADAVAGIDDLADVMETALVHGHRAIRDDAVLQMVLATEPEALLPVMNAQEPRIHEAIVEYLRPLVERAATAGRVRSDLDVEQATRYVAAMGLSLMATPGRVDLADPAAVRDVVRHELLGGVLVEP